MMGRSPGCDDNGLKKGPWTPDEDDRLRDYIQIHGLGSWRALPKLAGLNRCGKSCRLRWTNYLRPNIKRGNFSDEDEKIIINLHAVLGNKWSAIAAQLPGRTDNEIKNFWNTHLKKKLLKMGIDPITHRQRTDLNLLANLPQLLAAANLSNLMSPWDNALRLQADATQLAKIQVLHNLLQIMNTSALPNMEAINLLGSAPFRDNQLNECLGSNSQFEGLLNGLHGFYPNPTQIPSNFSNFGAPSDYQAIANSNVCFEGGPTPDVLNSNNHHFSGSYSDPTPITPIPALISASPEYSMVNQMESKINPTDISTHSTTSTTFEAWGELMDDDANESYWKDIL